MGDCKHNGMYWYAAPHNERGWKCVDCELQPGEEPGYSPQHDRDWYAERAAVPQEAEDV